MWLLLVSILANYVLGLVMDKTQTVGARRTALILGILANLGILGYYKYFNFFINTLNKVAGRELLSMKDIALPLGVSFFTFQAMSYLIDLYKKKYGAQKNILNMALYFAFFPKITQGPIEKYRDFEKQLTERKQSLSLMGEGIRRFVYGLAKKVIIADALGSCVDRIYGLDLANVNGVLHGLPLFFIPFSFYYDFSRIFRYGGGTWEDVRLYPGGKLQLPLHCLHDYGFLAQMAYFPHLLVQGIPVFLIGRQPEGQAAHLH